MGKVDLLFLFIPFVHRKVDNPAQLEAILGDEVKLLADFGARRAGEFVESLRIAGDKEHGVALAK